MVVTKGYYTWTNLHLKAAGLFKYLWPLPPYIKGLKFVFLATSQNSWGKSICNFIVKLQSYKWLNWILTHFQLFAITDFAKIISSLSGSKTNQFQGTPLNGCFWNNSFTRVVKIWKWLQNVSVAAVRGCF